jgi:hypothetical protein
MMKMLLTIGMAMSVLVGKAESVKVVYHILSEDGNPVTNAVVKTTTERDRLNISWTKPIKMKTWTVSSGKDGRAVLNFTCYSGYFEVEVSADGFYPERLRDQHFAIKLNSSNTGYIFEEREKELTITLRRIINPIDMVVHRFPHKNFPCRSGEFGFDLERCDWTSPLGAGKVADVTFKYDLVVTNDVARCTGLLSLNASGGAYKLKKQKGTSFVSVYEADSNATYRTEFPFSSYCSYKDSGDYGSVRVAEGDEYLVFRTRVVKDEKGNIVSANYGKIYGAIRTVGFFGANAIYFNPTPNDTNLEARR